MLLFLTFEFSLGRDLTFLQEEMSNDATISFFHEMADLVLKPLNMHQNNAVQGSNSTQHIEDTPSSPEQQHKLNFADVDNLWMDPSFSSSLVHSAPLQGEEQKKSLTRADFCNLFFALSQMEQQGLLTEVEIEKLHLRWALRADVRADGLTGAEQHREEGL